MPLVFSHSIITRNLGDLGCCPKDYFPPLNNVPVVDLSTCPIGPVIFGGGGFHQDVLDVFEIAKWPPRIIWSMGANGEFGDPPKYTPTVHSFELVGCRDYLGPFQYVPCVSCLHPAFDLASAVAPKHELVVYESHADPIFIPSCVPTLSNHCDNTMTQAIMHIGSGNTVLTNSYHGAYWGLLLGRNVVGWKLRANKFKYLKYPVPSVDNIEDTKRTWVSSEPGYLNDCRTRNVNFYEQVFSLLTEYGVELQ